MKKQHSLYSILWGLAFLLLSSCMNQQSERSVQLVVSNTSLHDLHGVVSGLSLQSVMDSLLVDEANSIAVLDEQGKPVMTQIFDNGQQKLLLFECSVLAEGESTYTLSASARVSASTDSNTLPIAHELRRLQQIRTQADTVRAHLATALYNWEINECTREADSLMRLLDVTLLGGRLYPYPASAPRNPWNYSQFSILAEGPLMCAYQLHYDTLRLAGDTLVEHRTLVMQRGSHLTIVRDLLENAGHQDTLQQLNQLAIALPCQLSDSLVVDQVHSYLAIEHHDSIATGLFVPSQTQSLRMADSRQSAFLLPFLPDSIMTYYVAHDLSSSSTPLTLPDLQQELMQMHDAPLNVRIVVH